MNKFLFKLAAVICSIFLVLGAAACSGNHTHIWAEGWDGNDANHWHNCSVSGCKQRSDIAPHSWMLTSTLENSTCTEEGLGIYTCFICGRTKQDTIEKSGHDWILFRTEYAPNCITEGRGTFRCATCGTTQDKMTIPATGEHNYATAWTSEESGHYHVCTVEGCGATTESINHVESGPITVAEQDYVDGADEIRCVDCGYLLSSVRRPARSIPVSFDVQFGTVMATNGQIDLTTKTSSSTAYVLSFPNGINEYGDAISSLPIYSGGVGVSVYLVMNDLGDEMAITYGSNYFSIYGNTIYAKSAGTFTLKFKFMADGEVKAETVVRVTVTIVT